MNDLDLFTAWCDDDRAAGNALVQRHFAALYRFFLHTAKTAADTEDLVQETFLACVQNKHKFRRESPFRSFLFGIARHRLYAYWRSRARQGHALDFTEISVEDLAATPRTQIAAGEDRRRLLLALRGLPLDQQVLLMLHYWERMEQDALAVVFGVAPATTRSRLFRAREALRERLRTMEGVPDSSELSFEDLEAWALHVRGELDAEDCPPKARGKK